MAEVGMTAIILLSMQDGRPIRRRRFNAMAIPIFAKTTAFRGIIFALSVRAVFSLTVCSESTSDFPESTSPRLPTLKKGKEISFWFWKSIGNPAPLTSLATSRSLVSIQPVGDSSLIFPHLLLFPRARQFLGGRHFLPVIRP